jgi:hypothetical protein
MPPQIEPLPPATRGEKAGRLAASEMINTASPETGGLQGVMSRLGAVGSIVAEGHLKTGMQAAEVRAWHIGFQAGISLELGEHMRRLRSAT